MQDELAGEKKQTMAIELENVETTPPSVAVTVESKI